MILAHLFGCVLKRASLQYKCSSAHVIVIGQPNVHLGDEFGIETMVEDQDMWCVLIHVRQQARFWM